MQYKLSLTLIATSLMFHQAVLAANFGGPDAVELGAIAQGRAVIEGRRG